MAAARAFLLLPVPPWRGCHLLLDDSETGTRRGEWILGRCDPVCEGALQCCACEHGKGPERPTARVEEIPYLSTEMGGLGLMLPLHCTRALNSVSG